MRKLRSEVSVTSRAISVDRVLKSVSDKSAGGTVIFVGTVRDNSKGVRVTAIELESARDLAEADLKSIADKALKRFEVSRLTIVHRLGRLEVGDVIVAIAVSAPHRQHAFVACKFVIDELKKTTPIWKREYGPGVSRWVEG